MKKEYTDFVKLKILFQHFLLLVLQMIFIGYHIYFHTCIILQKNT